MKPTASPTKMARMMAFLASESPAFLTNQASTANSSNAAPKSRATEIPLGLSVTPYWDLAEGMHTLTVTAADVAGNVTSVTVHFVCDRTPPVITVMCPADGSATALGSTTSRLKPAPMDVSTAR